MKKLIKSALSVALVLSMVLSLGLVSFAAAPVDPISSHVEFVVDGTSVYAKALVRDITPEYADNARYSQLIIAAYDSTGKLAGAKVETGRNGLFETDPVTLPDGGYVKAFVWANETGKILSDVATYKATGYDFNAVLDTLEITFDGKSFAEYTGQAFNKATTTYNNIAINGDFPDVKATVGDNAAFTEVVVTDTQIKVTVKSSVAMTYTTGNVTNHWGQAATGTRPNYTNTRTYVLNYTNQKTKINPKEFLYLDANAIKRLPNFPAANNTAGAGAVKFPITNIASAMIGYEEEPVKVTVTSSAALNQNLFIVVRPASGTNGIDNQVIVNPDGSAIGGDVKNNGDAWHGKNPDGGANFEKLSTTTPVTFTGASTVNLPVSYNLRGAVESVGYTGSDIANRFPRSGSFHLMKINDTAKGAEFIALNFGDQGEGASGGTFTFYVGQAAYVDVYATSAVTNANITVTADDTPVTASPKVTENGYVGYKTPVDRDLLVGADKWYFDLTLAYFDKLGYVNGIDYVYDANAGTLLSFGGIFDQKCYGVNCYSESERLAAFQMLILSSEDPVGPIAYINSNTKLQGAIDPDQDPRLTGLGLSTDNGDAAVQANKAKILTLIDENYTVKKPTLNVTNWTMTPSPVDWAAEIGGSYNYATDVMASEIAIFDPGTLTAADKTNQSATNMTTKTGTNNDRYVPIAVYEPLFELVGGIMIKANQEWINNGQTQTGVNTTKIQYSNDLGHNGVRNTTGESFYTFKVEKDSEVIVHTLSGTGYRWQHPNMTAEGWVWLGDQADTDGDGNFENIRTTVPCYSSGSTGSYPYVGNHGLACSKFYPAGSTVTIRVPHAGMRPHVYVRPL